MSCTYTRPYGTLMHLAVRPRLPQARLAQSFPNCFIFAKSRRMTSTTPNYLRDPNTLSNYHEFITIHTIANFSIDFGKKNLVGNVLLKLKAVNKACQEVVLDTSYLDIQDVRIDSHALKWDLLPRSEPLGSALKIRLDKAVRETEFVEIDVSRAKNLLPKWIFDHGTD